VIRNRKTIKGLRITHYSKTIKEKKERGENLRTIPERKNVDGARIEPEKRPTQGKRGGRTVNGQKVWDKAKGGTEGVANPWGESRFLLTWRSRGINRK